MKTILVLVLGFLLSLTATAEIRFLRGPFTDAVKKAEAQKKPVMIDFITDWCRWCDTLDARTYSDTKVARYINDHVIPIKIDAEKGDGIDIAKKYGVAAYPTIVFIQANGEEIDRILGYVQSEPFLKRASDYVNGVNTLSDLLKKVGSAPDDAGLRYALASKYMDRNNTPSAAEQFKKMLELDPKNTLGHNDEAEFTIASATFKENKDPSALEAIVAKDASTEYAQRVSTTLWRYYIKAKDGENGRKYFTQYIDAKPTDASSMNNYAWICAENGVNLEHAAEVAKKAAELATTDADRASFIDTHATVEFARGNSDMAIALEEQALNLLKNVPGAKLTEYEKSMAKFKAGRKTSDDK